MTGTETAQVITLGEALAFATLELTGARVDSPRLDARLLVAAACESGPGELLAHPERPVARSACELVREYVRRRADREPVSRIIGRREFWSLPFAVTPETLDPRPESETVVEAVLAHIADRQAPLRILDLGTGTGCLLLALLHELPRATGLGIDISPECCETARHNAELIGLATRARFAVGYWTRGVEGPFNILVTNPPYIPEAEINSLAPEVARYDPRRALAGGRDGLACYRAIVPALKDLLAPGGLAALEIGAGQEEAVSGLLRRHGFADIAVRNDIAGHPRCVTAAGSVLGRG